MTGGKKPYTVTVAEANTAFSFNSSMGPNDDTFTWVNNLSPGGQVICKFPRHLCSRRHPDPVLTYPFSGCL
jgi:hypothetical protein